MATFRGIMYHMSKILHLIMGFLVYGEPWWCVLLIFQQANIYYQSFNGNLSLWKETIM